MALQRISTLSGKRLAIMSIATALLIGTLAFLYVQNYMENHVEIQTDKISGSKLRGKVVHGKDTDPSPIELSTNSELTYESDVLTTSKKTTNAAYINWEQSRPNEEGVEIEVRVNNGREWSDWINATTDVSERPDSAPPTRRGGFIVGDNMTQLQYRLVLSGTQEQASPRVDLSTVELQTIDASKGPSIGKKTAWQTMLGFIGLGNDVQARGDGPRINSRLVWGSPEPYGSPRWDTEYVPLHRTIVHHTATVSGSDSAASIRAIWEYHANTLGWGDIGYNYLVDQAGNIFQGRYFDATYAEQHNADVVAGHAYENNRGTTGIAALGDFTNNEPSNSLLHYIGEVAAYKMGPYGLNPAGGETFGGNLLSHRDVLPTSCPGQRLYDKLQTIRNVASALYPRYYVPPYSWQYIAQYAYSDPARQVPVDPSTGMNPGQRLYLTVQAKNAGTRVWYREGDTPPVRLATSRPQDGASQLCDASSWINCSRAATIAEPAVAPGQIGSFQYEAIVPANPTNDIYSFREYFNIVAEGVTWLNDPGLYWTVAIKKPYAWEYVGQRSYLDPGHTQAINLNTTLLNPGQKVYMVLDAKNSGTGTWFPNGANPVRLGTARPQDRISPFCDDTTWLSCQRLANVKTTTAPQEVGQFEFTIIAPQNTSGQEKQYKEYLNLLAEGKTWLNDLGLYWTIRVK